MQRSHHDEGVIKFQADHEHRSLEAARFGELACELIAWREILTMTELIGQDGARYGGAGFGNVSARLPPFPGERGRRAFLITGTQTGGVRQMGLEHFCAVQCYDARQNRVDSCGPILPSSEAMTHGAIYDLGPQIRYVFHAHAPAIWEQAGALRLPTTSPGVAYGTPEMVHEVQRLFRETALADLRVLAMGGHDDGVIVFGRTAEEAGQVLLATLARAFQRRCQVPPRAAGR